MRKFVCMLLTFLVLTLSVTTVSFADEVAVKKMNSEDKSAREIELSELDKINIQSIDRVGESKTIKAGKTKTWKLYNLKPSNKEIILALEFEDYEDGTPFAAKLINNDTGKSYGVCKYRLSEGKPIRHISFYVYTNQRCDYILEVTHRSEKYESFTVTPYQVKYN